MKEGKLSVEVEGRTIDFVFRRLTYGQRNECLRQSTKMDAMSREAKIDPYLFNELRIVQSIVTPVEYKNLERVKQLDPDAGDKIASYLDELNGVSPLPNGSSGAASPVE